MDESRTDRAPAALPGVEPGTPLGAWYRFLGMILRTVYFGRVCRSGPGASTPRGTTSGPTSGTDPSGPSGPRLIIASHRNGAIDGVQVLAAYPRAQFLVSIQLLRNPILRLLFTGIPVVRRKDVERYGLDPAAVRDPVSAGLAHLRAGGDLAIFPEGTSQWGHAPQPYQRGAARIARRAIGSGIDLTIVPIGLHYSTPDAFRSRVELYEGPPVVLPPREVDEKGSESGSGALAWERTLADALGEALDAVSVKCPDEATFRAVQQVALQRARQGEAYAPAYLQEQAQGLKVTDPESELATPVQAPLRHPMRLLGLGLLWLFWPVLLVGFLAGRKADARNTISFFRIAAGLGAMVFWVPLLILGALFFPWVVLVGVLCALVGWTLLGAPRWRP